MFADFPVICSITRADLIADGDLVDVSATAREAGFKLPVAISRAAWTDAVEWTDDDNRRKGTLQDEAGRLWDVLWMASLAARRASNSSDRREFSLLRTPHEGRGRAPKLATLKLVCGPGDAAEPVITILLPNED